MEKWGPLGLDEMSGKEEEKKSHCEEVGSGLEK